MKVSDWADRGDVIEWEDRLWVILHSPMNLRWLAIEVDGGGYMRGPTPRLTSISYEVLRDGKAKKSTEHAAHADVKAFLDAIAERYGETDAMILRLFDWAVGKGLRQEFMAAADPKGVGA